MISGRLWPPAEELEDLALCDWCRLRGLMLARSRLAVVRRFSVASQSHDLVCALRRLLVGTMQQSGLQLHSATLQYGVTRAPVSLSFTLRSQSLNWPDRL